MYLTLRQHPAWVRESSGRNGEYPIDYKTFENILRDFSQLKIGGELSAIDSNDFKEDLLRNEPDAVVNFIEKSIEASMLHPYVHLLLFETAKQLLLQNKISREKYSFLCEKLFKERGDEIARRYDAGKVRTILAAA